MASGAAVLTTTYGMPDREALLPQLTAATHTAYSGNAIVFGAILARAMLFSEATFKFQARSDKKLTDLPPRASLLETPWPNGTTGELLVRMEQDASLAGNAYIWNTGDGMLARLRPDWVTTITEEIVDPTGMRTYRRPFGYWYEPPAGVQLGWGPPQMYDVSEVAHWSPIPDPDAQFRGMSWLTPVLREVGADDAMTAYKTQYLNNAATPNLLIKYDRQLLPETVERIRERVQARYAGVGNAFRTLVLDQGADATVVGHSFEQMNFSTVQGAGENRILIASGVPGIVVGAQVGLSAATYSNYAQAMRRFADITMRPLWRSVCSCLSALVPVPAGQRLWYDTSDIAALRQGEKERADTLLVKGQAIGELVKAGYEPASVVAAVESGDLSQLAFKKPSPVPEQPFGDIAVLPSANGNVPAISGA
jgi:phage portal protein BeeE